MGENSAAIDLKVRDINTQEALTRALEKFTAFGDKVGGALKKIAVTAAGLFGLKKIFDFGQDALQSGMESEEAVTRLEAVLASTGNTAGYTSEQLQQMANDLMGLTNETDEAVMGVETMMLKFKNVRGDEFRRAMYASADLAKSLKMDLGSAAQVVGRSLQEPVMAMMMLRRQGIEFNAEEQKTITTMVQTNQTAEAQRLILDKLEAQYGKNAEKMRNTFGERMKNVWMRLGDVMDSLGLALIKAFTPVLPLIEGAVGAFEWLGGAAARLIELIAPGFEVVSAAIMKWYEDSQGYFESFYNTMKSFLEPIISWAIDAFAGYAAAVWTSYEAVYTALTGMVKSFMEWATSGDESVSTLVNIFNWLRDTVTGIFTVISTTISNWSLSWDLASTSATLQVVRIWENFKYYLGEVIPELLKWFGTTMIQLFTDAANFTMTVFSNLWKNIASFFENVWNWIKGDETNWEWTSLTEGLELTVKKWPDIVDRGKSEMEKVLEKDLDDLAGKYAKALDKTAVANASRKEVIKSGLTTALKNAWNAVAKPELKGPTDMTPNGDKYNDPRTAMKLGRPQGDKDFKAQFVDLTSLSKNIQQAAASASKDDKMIGAMDRNTVRQVQAIEEGNKELADQSDKLDKLIMAAELGGGLN